MWMTHALLPFRIHYKLISSPETMTRFNIHISTRGGGLRGQAGAACLGIARALIKYDPDMRPALKKGGFLTRDPREKERKKYGLAGARKRFQFSKR